MQINKDILATLEPCKERFDNFLEHYSNFNGSFSEFIDLENVSYSDKIWVAKKMLNKNQLVHFGILCAESVLNIFESKYPEDKRVRECIDLLKSKKDFTNLSSEELEEIRVKRNGASAASYAADAADASYAAYAAYYAANAAYNAANAAYASAADAAYYRKQQEQLNLEFLKVAVSL